ncbi:MAG: sigma-70 family RNA polymerase sigma factor [Myxococcaceae bacterium]|nr:sigma-70 family RNA polymerase sigma factor [Myxococcaceae bacterium]
MTTSEALDRQLDELALAPADRARCRAWVEARVKQVTAEAAPGDVALVWAVLQGHPRALKIVDELIEAHARRAAGRAIEPAELAQRVRTRLLVAPKGKEPRLATYDGRGKLKSWLWTATRLELLQATRGMGQAPADDIDELGHLAATDRSPEAAARSKKDTKLVSDALQAALEVLEPKERTLLRMRFVDGVSTEELGRMFQVHRTTAQRWIEAAQAKIMAAMRARLAHEARLKDGEIDALVGEVAQSISLRLSQVLRRDEFSP